MALEDTRDGRRLLRSFALADEAAERVRKGGMTMALKDQIPVFYNNEFVYPAPIAAAGLHDDDLVQLVPRGHPYPLRCVGDVHGGGECGSRRGTVCPVQSQPGHIHFTAPNSAGGDDLWSFPGTQALPAICHHHGAAVRGHVRESATPFGDGTIIGDCSCGAEYTVKQGADEYGALEAAHRLHVSAVTEKDGEHR